MRGARNGRGLRPWMVAAMVVLVATMAMAGGRPQTVCPVMGGVADPNLYVDVNGKRIFICCRGCEDAIRAEPQRYIDKIEKRGETVADTPAPTSSAPPPGTP